MIAGRKGLIVLKLFNLMVRELGPTFLDQGILISREDLEEFLRSLPRDFWEECKMVKVNGKEMGWNELLKMKWYDDKALICLRVCSCI